MKDNKSPLKEGHTYDNGLRPKEVKLKPGYKFYPTNIIFNFFSKLFMFITWIYMFFVKKVMLGYKVRGKKNFKKARGSFLVSNHIHPLDCFCIATSIYPRRMYVLSLQSNLGFGLVSKYFRISALVPIPEKRQLLKQFKEETIITVKKKKNILIFPEGSLGLYNLGIREFKSGAFGFAYEAGAKIIPMVFTFHKPRGLYKLYKKKPCLRLNILPAYEIEDIGNKKDSINKASLEVHKIMSDFFNEHSEIQDEI